jgi:hypothetical protein
VNILGAFLDRRVFGKHFPGPTWRPWHALLATLTGQVAELPPDLQSLAAACTGREDLATAGPFSELWAFCGRRSGKSRVAAGIATWIACSTNWRTIMAPGEVATVALIAESKAQARISFRYVRALIRSTPLLAPMVTSETAERIELNNGAAVEVLVASGVRVRGYSLAAAVLDEICYWPTDSASATPDTEVLAALRPALATLPGSRLICISSPYARHGEAWNAYSRYFGRLGAPTLVWTAPTRVMNSTVSAEVVADALRDDPQRGAAEWLGEFRTDAERLFGREVVEQSVVTGRHELAKLPGGIRYHAHCDPSGGSSDAMTLCIGHAEGDQVIIDATRCRVPPFNADSVCSEFSTLLKTFGLTKVTGDRYGGEWPKQRFAEHGITYEFSIRSASDLYLESLPLFNAGRVQLLDDPLAVVQLVSLERRTSRAGRDVISHPPNSHDDLANSVCGAVVLASGRAPPKIDFVGGTIINYPTRLLAAGSDTAYLAARYAAAEEPLP